VINFGSGCRGGKETPWVHVFVKSFHHFECPAFKTWRLLILIFPNQKQLLLDAGRCTSWRFGTPS
jgi:hypothetical protein